MKLIEWTELYLKNQDLLRKQIEQITVTDMGLLVRKKDKEETWIVQEELTLDPTVAGIVCLNTKANVLALAKNWSSIKDASTRLVFANPKTNERWVLIPEHHNRVADAKNLKEGLQSLYSSIASA